MDNFIVIIILKKLQIMDFLGGLVAKTAYSVQRARVWLLVGELRSHNKDPEQPYEKINIKNLYKRNKIKYPLTNQQQGPML